MVNYRILKEKIRPKKKDSKIRPLNKITPKIFVILSYYVRKKKRNGETI